MDEYARLYTLGRSNGIESFLLSPEETKKRFPLVNVDDVYGTLYCPGSGKGMSSFKYISQYITYSLIMQEIQKTGILIWNYIAYQFSRYTRC